MLQLLADSVRHRGPAGALFVVLVVGMVGGMIFWSLWMFWLPPLGLVALWFVCRAWRNRQHSGNLGISRLPKLGRDDLPAIRSKLQQRYPNRK